MKKYRKKDILTFNSQQEKLYPNSIIKNITFQITEDCCLNCSYCYQHRKSKKKMTFEIAKKFIDDLLNDKIKEFTRQDTDGIIVEFIGGEPLLEIELIEQIWKYLLTQLVILEHPWLTRIRCSICSNGILYFQPKVQEFFNKYHPFISFCISIDGNKELHDTCRVDWNGNGSYDRAIAAVHHYRENFDSSLPTKMTLAPSNVHYTYDAVVNLINEGYDNIALNCVFEPGWEWSHARILYKEMIKLADYIIDNKLNETIYISLFDEGLFCPMDEDDNSNWCGGVDNRMFALSPEGDYYTCIRYMESSLNGKQKPLKLGNIYEGHLTKNEYIQTNNLLLNITRRSQSTDECFYCPIAKGCAWCSAFNYEEFGTVNQRATYICVMHKARALANVYYWNKIYKKYNINKTFPNYLSKEDIQNIQGENNNE